MKKSLKIVILAASLILALAIPTAILASQIPVAPSVFETYLASQEGTTDTSVTLASGTLRDGTALSGYACVTVDANTPTLEYECGNASGTSITNLTRGIDAVTGTTTVSSLIYSHRRGADVKITDYPVLTLLQRIASGLLGFPSIIRYDTQPNFSGVSTTSIASVGYVNSVAISGAPNASESVNGISQLATTNQLASSTSLGSTGARLVIPNSLATTTCSVATSSVILSGPTTGKISSACIDQTAAYNWTGNQTFAASSTYSLVPPGSIEAYASSTAPLGWLLANGSVLATSTFPNLFSVIGYTYGGNGTSTFALPNAQGRFLYGFGSSTTPTIGAAGGATSTVLTQANIPSYSLIAPANGSTGTGGTGFFDTSSSGSGTMNIPSGGSGLPATTTPPYLVINYIIKY